MKRTRLSTLSPPPKKKKKQAPPPQKKKEGYANYAALTSCWIPLFNSFGCSDRCFFENVFLFSVCSWFLCLFLCFLGVFGVLRCFFCVFRLVYIMYFFAFFFFGGGVGGYSVACCFPVLFLMNVVCFFGLFS